MRDSREVHVRTKCNVEELSGFLLVGQTVFSAHGLWNGVSVGRVEVYGMTAGFVCRECSNRYSGAVFKCSDGGFQFVSGMFCGESRHDMRRKKVVSS